MGHPNPTQPPTTLQVYPNPAEETVVLIGLDVNTSYSVTVLNSSGMMVLHETQMSSNLLGELPISVPTLPSGIYFIRVKGVSETMMAKFVKQ